MNNFLMIRKEAAMTKLALTSVFIAGFSVLSYAQPGNAVMDIYGTYTPKIVEANKLNEQPAIVDTGTGRLDISYEFSGKRMNTIYEVDPIKAASVKGEPLNKLYRGYAKAGFGTYTTPYAELYFHTLRSKKYAAGLHYKHLSSTGQLADVLYSGYSNNNASVWGKQFIKKSTLSGGITYNRDVVHYYGVNMNPLPLHWQPYSLNRSDIRQVYQMVDINAGLSDNYPVDSNAVKHNIKLDYYNYRDLYNTTENGFKAAGNLSFYFRNYNLGASTSLQYYGLTNDSVGNTTMTIFNLRPHINFTQEKWRLNAALNMFASGDSSYGFRIVPELDFDLHIYKNIIIFNAGTDSRMFRHTYRNLTAENPFLVSHVQPANSWMPFRLYAGLRGALGSRMAFNVKASYVQVENQYFYVHDTTAGNWNKLNVVYDNATLVQVNGELTWQQNEKISFIGTAHYLGYTPDTEMKAWHTPALRLSFMARYQLRDKIRVNASILGISKQYSREFRINETTGLQEVYAREMEGITDINLGIEYRYTKLLGMFVQCNNILNVRYQRYRDYPTQRFNLLAGISYSFR